MAYLFVILLFASAAQALTVKLTFEWDASTTAGVVGYRLYYGEQSGGPYVPLEDYGNVTTGEAIIDIFPGEVFYFVLDAFTAAMDRSKYSNEATFFLPDQPGTIVVSPPSLRLKSWEDVSSKLQK
jgi:hypothetical protein